MKKLAAVLFGLCVVCSLAIMPVMAGGVSQNAITTPAPASQTANPTKKHRKGMKRHGKRNHKNSTATTQATQVTK